MKNECPAMAVTTVHLSGFGRIRDGHDDSNR
jgi:hypothetical protein